jgi:glutamate-1-semialdehyde 2,1-aminomutase
MASGLATLNLVSQPGFLDPIIEQTTVLVSGLIERARAAGISLTGNHVGTMWGIFFSEQEKITNYNQVMNCNQRQYAQFFHGMLNQGVYLAPASYEAGFMSAAHSEGEIEFTLNAAERVFSTI